jgi:hypothetical protein
MLSHSLLNTAPESVAQGHQAQTAVSSRFFTFSVKFVCGSQHACDCACMPLRPGSYATEINLHNFATEPAEVLMRFIPLVLGGAPAGREPATSAARAEQKLRLPQQTATMLDCCRIVELLFDGESSGESPLNIGFVELTSTVNLSVTAVYTTSSEHGGVGLKVEQIFGRQG